MTPTTNLEAIRLAEASDWKGLQRLIEKAPEYAREMGEYGMLPIHWACTESHVPVSLLHRLLSAYPDGAHIKNDAQLLPLHIAIRARVECDWIECLLDAYPDAVDVSAPDGVSVLELADQVGLGPDAIKVLRRASNESNQDDIMTSMTTLKDPTDNVERPEHDYEAPWSRQSAKIAPLVGTRRANNNSALSHQSTPVSPVHSLPSGDDVDDDAVVVSPHDQPLVSPSSSSGSSVASSANTAPLPQTVAPLPKPMIAPFQRKYSLDYHAHAAAAAAAAAQHQELLMLRGGGGRRGPGQKQQRSMSLLGGRHQSLPVIPSFEHVNFMPQFQSPHDDDPSSEEDEDNQRHQHHQHNHPRRSSTMASRSKTQVANGGRTFESPPEWKRDDECSICRASFGMFKHRHHCRNCGKSICSQHSADKKIMMESKGFTTPQRVCVTCYAMITHKESRLHEFDPMLDGATISGPVAAFHLQQQLQHSSSPLQSTPMRSASSGSSSATGTAGSAPSGSSPLSTAMSSTSTAPTLAAKEKIVESWLIQAQMNEMRHAMAQQQKQIEQLTQANMQMQQQILEQEELKAETMLLITQLMTRVSMLELRKHDEHHDEDDDDDDHHTRPDPRESTFDVPPRP